MDVSNIKKIFFYRICGTGMGAAACLLKEAGFEIEGGDLSFSPPMSTYLETTGIPLLNLKETQEGYLKKYDLIVVGNSVPKNSEYAKEIENSGVSYISFPKLLGELILKKRNVIGITGTHGKTTTSFFMTKLLENLGENPGYLIGGIMEGRAPSRLGSGYFVIEGDEYDSAYFEKISKFRLYELKHMILTSLEYDHADIFPDVEAIKNEFRAVIPRVKTLVMCSDYAASRELALEFKDKKIVTYGSQSGNGPFEIKTSKEGSSFSFNYNNKIYSFKSNIIGEHNVYNLTSCLLFLLEEGYPYEKLKEAALNLQMVKRRQEFRGKYKEAFVIDDFAHHPRAVTLTIDSIRKAYPSKKIFTVFEPISATARSSLFQEEFKMSLSSSDKLLIASNSLKTTVKGSENLNGEKIIEYFNGLGKKGNVSYSLEDLRQKIDENVEKDDVLLILSNRTCLGLWDSDFVKELT